GISSCCPSALTNGSEEILSDARSLHIFHGTVEWVGLDWSGLGWIGLDWVGLDWIGLDGIRLDWIGLDWMGLDWTGLDGIGLDWIGLDGIGLDWIGWDGIGWDGMGWDWMGLDWIGLEGTLRSFSSIPCHGQGHLPLSQSDPSPSVQPGLGHSRDPGAATASLGIPSQPGIPSQSPIHPCPLAVETIPYKELLGTVEFPGLGININLKDLFKKIFESFWNPNFQKGEFKNLFQKEILELLGSRDLIQPRPDSEIRPHFAHEGENPKFVTFEEELESFPLQYIAQDVKTLELLIDPQSVDLDLTLDLVVLESHNSFK
ncbi:hypothetical protein HGM15179_017533, partial [Zosterops borbonicus]